MITVPFIFVCENTNLENDKLSIDNLFETYYFDPGNHFMEDSKVTIGLLGNIEDDGQELTVSIAGAPLEPRNIEIPIKFKYSKANIISLVGFTLNHFPIYPGETIFIQVHNSGKQLGIYPVSFVAKTVKEE